MMLTESENRSKAKENVVSVPTHTVTLIIQDYQECRSSDIRYISPESIMKIEYT